MRGGRKRRGRTRSALQHEDRNAYLGSGAEYPLAVDQLGGAILISGSANAFGGFTGTSFSTGYLIDSAGNICSVSTSCMDFIKLSECVKLIFILMCDTSFIIYPKFWHNINSMTKHGL